MTPEKIKQLTPDGYGGDFELTCASEEKVQVKVQVGAQVNRDEYAYGVQVRAQVEVQDEITMEVGV